MSSFSLLVQFIDHHTNEGTTEPGPGWGDDEFLDKQGLDYFNKFTVNDWELLRSFWGNKSEIWIELLVYLVSGVNNDESKALLVAIAKNGSDESIINVMEYIREFVKEIDPEVFKEIEEKSWSIINIKMDKSVKGDI